MDGARKMPLNCPRETARSTLQSKLCKVSTCPKTAQQSELTQPLVPSIQRVGKTERFRNELFFNKPAEIHDSTFGIGNILLARNQILTIWSQPTPQQSNAEEDKIRKSNNLIESQTISELTSREWKNLMNCQGFSTYFDL